MELCWCFVLFIIPSTTLRVPLLVYETLVARELLYFDVNEVANYVSKFAITFGTSQYHGLVRNLVLNSPANFAKPRGKVT